MLNLTRQSFDKIKKILLNQQKKVEEELKNLEIRDPVLSDSLAETSEPGTDSWMADVHTRALAIKQNLQVMLEKTKKSLLKLKSGKYGICDKCGRQIESKRLEVMLTANLCLACSKKSSK